MTRRTSKTAFSVFLLCVVAFFLSQTLALHALARLVPLSVIIPTLAFLIAQVSIDFRGGLPSKDKTLFGNADQYREKALLPKPDETARRQTSNLAGIVWLVSMLGLVYLLGFLVASVLYTFLYLRFRGRKNWRLSAVVASGVGVLSYALVTILSNGSPYVGKVWLWFV
jgi:hypothetical protein